MNIELNNTYQWTRINSPHLSNNVAGKFCLIHCEEESTGLECWWKGISKYSDGERSGNTMDWYTIITSLQVQL